MLCLQRVESFRFWLRALLYLRAYPLKCSSPAWFLCLSGLTVNLPQSCYKTLSSSSLFLSNSSLPPGALLPLSCCSVPARSTAVSFLSNLIAKPAHGQFNNPALYPGWERCGTLVPTLMDTVTVCSRTTETKKP